MGTLAVLHPSVLSNIDKKCAIAFFEIKTEAFAKSAVSRISYKAPSKFPTIEIDLTFNANLEELSFSEVIKLSRESAGALLSDVKAQDIYTNEEGKTALTLRFFFSSAERTLTKQELQPTTEAIISALAACNLTFKA